MQIDVLKAIDGVSYPFQGEEAIPDTLFEPRAIRAEGCAEISGEYRVEDGLVLADFKLELSLIGECERCLDEVKFQISADAKAAYSRNSEDEDGTYPYTGYTVDLTGAIYEEILMRVPTIILCKEDCKGLCPRCGANRNRETCGCETRTEQSPFAILQQTIAGGANDGSTEK